MLYDVKEKKKRIDEILDTIGDKVHTASFDSMVVVIADKEGTFEQYHIFGDTSSFEWVGALEFMKINLLEGVHINEA